MRDITLGSSGAELRPTTQGTQEYNIAKDMAKFETGNTVAIAKGFSESVSEAYHTGWGLTSEYLADKVDSPEMKNRFKVWDEEHKKSLVNLADKEKYSSYNNQISYGIGGFAGDFAGDFVSPTGLAREGMEWTTNIIGFGTGGFLGLVAAQTINAGWSSKMSTYEQAYQSKALGFENDMTHMDLFKQELVVRAVLVGALSGGVKAYRYNKAKKAGKVLDESPNAVIEDIIEDKETTGFKDKRNAKETEADLDKKVVPPIEDTPDFVKNYKAGKIDRKTLVAHLERMEDARDPAVTRRIRAAAEISANINGILRKETEIIKSGQFGEVIFDIDRSDFSDELLKTFVEEGDANVMLAALEKLMLEDPTTKARMELDYHDLMQGSNIPDAPEYLNKLSRKDFKKILLAAKEAKLKLTEEVVEVKTDKTLQVEAKELLGDYDAMKTVDDIISSQAKSATTTKEAKVSAKIDKTKDKIVQEKVAAKAEKAIDLDEPKLMKKNAREEFLARNEEVEVKVEPVEKIESDKIEESKTPSKEIAMKEIETKIFKDIEKEDSSSFYVENDKGESVFVSINHLIGGFDSVSPKYVVQSSSEIGGVEKYFHTVEEASEFVTKKYGDVIGGDYNENLNPYHEYKIQEKKLKVEEDKMVKSSKGNSERVETIKSNATITKERHIKEFAKKNGMTPDELYKQQKVEPKVEPVKIEETETLATDKKPQVTEEEIRTSIAKEASITKAKETTVEAIELSNIIKSDVAVVLKKKKAEPKKPKVKKLSPTQKYLAEVTERTDFVKKAEVEREVLQVETTKLEEKIRNGQQLLKQAKDNGDKKLSKKISAKIKDIQKELSEKKASIGKVKAKEVIVTSVKEHIEEFKSANKKLSAKIKTARGKLKKVVSDAELKKLQSNIDDLKKEHLQNTKNINRSEGFEFDASISGNIEEFKKIDTEFKNKISEAESNLKDKKEFSVASQKAKKKLTKLEKEYSEVKKEQMRVDGYQMGIDTVDSHEELLNKRILINDEPVVITDVRVQWNTKEVLSANNAKKTRDGQISKAWDDEKHTYIQYTKANGEVDYMYIEDLDWFDQPRLYAKEEGADFDPDLNEAYDKTNQSFLNDPSFVSEVEEGARIARIERYAEEGYTAEEIAQVEKQLKDKTWSKTSRQIETQQKTQELIGDLVPELEDLDAESLIKVTEESGIQSGNSNNYNNHLHSEYLFKNSKLGKKYNEFLKIYKRIEGRQFPSDVVRKYKMFKGFTEDEVVALETRKDYIKNLPKEQKKRLLRDEKKYDAARKINIMKESFKADLIMKRNKSNDPGELLEIDNSIKKINNEMRYEFINSFETDVITSMKKKDAADFTSYERSLMGKMGRIKGTKISAIRAKAKAHQNLIAQHFGTMFRFSNIDSDVLLKGLDELEHQKSVIDVAKHFKDIEEALKAQKDFAIKANEMYDIDELSKPASASPYVHNELRGDYNAKDEYNLLELKKTDTPEAVIIKNKRNAKAEVTRWNKKHGIDMKLRISTELIDDDSLKLISKILSEESEEAGDMLRVLEQYLKREGVLDIFQEVNERKVGAINGFLEHRNYYQNMTNAEANLVREQTKTITEIIGNYDIKNMIKTCN